ncbi:sensor histidine kinase [Luethyella okanaganae]|uniref:histidine kinase n=1 Tax=Luethyella okanaganae TaxID=69372 RepID=A0ABW1VG63_9MICO
MRLVELPAGRAPLRRSLRRRANRDLSRRASSDGGITVTRRGRRRRKPPARILDFANNGAAEAALLAGSAAGATTAAIFLLLGRPNWGFGCASLSLTLAWSACGLVLRARRLDHRRLVELDERRADQAALLSHEIRTPLAIIQGAAELLAEESAGPLTPTQAKFIKRISDNAVRVYTFAEQMLIRARLEAGLFTIDRTDVDLRVLFRNVVEELSQISDATIMLVAPGAPVSVSVDGQLIRQVLINLINNAASSVAASGLVEVRIAPGEDEVMISVSDAGSGMTESQREQLFHRFTSGRPLGNGTGIGLFLSQQFVGVHGGRIYVDTITGNGTTMMFTLPLRTTQPNPPPLPNDHARKDDRRSRRLKARGNVR